MHEGSPKRWPYASSNSPLPLPEQAMLFTDDELVLLDGFAGEPSDDLLEGESLRGYFGKFGTPTASLGELLEVNGAPPIDERRPILLQGELANPYRLQEIKMGAIPLFPVRLEGICRTWADGLDPREAYPGIHHVTLARTAGWWERSHVGLASKEQLKKIRDWLDEGNRSAWRAGKLGEGLVRFEHDPNMLPPSETDIEWDGTKETVTAEMPEATGPKLSLDELLIVVHTRQGCYNHRGRLARCVHVQQRAFHEGLFRRGSSFRWSDVLTLR